MIDGGVTAWPVPNWGLAGTGELRSSPGQSRGLAIKTALIGRAQAKVAFSGTNDVNKKPLSSSSMNIRNVKKL